MREEGREGREREGEEGGVSSGDLLACLMFRSCGVCLVSLFCLVSCRRLCVHVFVCVCVCVSVCLCVSL